MITPNFHVRAAVLRPPDPKFALRVPRPALGTCRRAAHKSNHRRAPAVRSRHTGAEAEEATPWTGAAGSGVRRRGGTVLGRSGIQSHTDHQRGARLRRSLAQPAEPRAVAGDARDGPAAAALAPPPVRRGVRPFFCQIEAVETAIWLTEVAPKLGQRGGKFWAIIEGANAAGEPRAAPARAQARHGRRQDDGDGDADRLADGERRPPPEQQAVLPRLPDRRARHHHPGPAARAAAERSGELLPPPGDRARRHARRHRPREDRHHQLSRLQAARAHGGRQGHARSSRGLARRRSSRPSRPKARCSSA